MGVLLFDLSNTLKMSFEFYLENVTDTILILMRTVSTSNSQFFPYSLLITGFVTRRMPLVNQEVPTLPEHLSSPPVFVGLVLHDL